MCVGQEGPCGGRAAEGVFEDAWGHWSDNCTLVRDSKSSIPFGRWVGEDICMVGETWVMFGVGREAADPKSSLEPVLYPERILTEAVFR